jgi:hypothetical protein
MKLVFTALACMSMAMADNITDFFFRIDICKPRFGLLGRRTFFGTAQLLD